MPHADQSGSTPLHNTQPQTLPACKHARARPLPTSCTHHGGGHAQRAPRLGREHRGLLVAKRLAAPVGLVRDVVRKGANLAGWVCVKTRGVAACGARLHFGKQRALHTRTATHAMQVCRPTGASAAWTGLLLLPRAGPHAALTTTPTEPSAGTMSGTVIVTGAPGAAHMPVET